MKYFDELRLGDVVLTPGRTVTEADVVLFSALTADFSSVHTDESYAQKTSFGKRIAHGLLVLTLTRGLMSRAGIVGADAEEAYLGLPDVTFRRPTMLGDSVSVRCTVTELTEDGDGRSGVAVFRCEALNQNGEVLQESTHRSRLKKKKV